MRRASLQHSRSVPRESFASQADAWHERMHAALARHLPRADETPACLNAALRSWVLDRAVRKHPILIFAVGRTVGLREQQIEVAACAVELLHLFVEAHRVPPALVADEQSRAAHRAPHDYDQAMLLLVGDSLPPLAFRLLCVDPGLALAPSVRLQLTAMLAAASGSRGRLGRYMPRAADEAADFSERARRADYRTDVRLAVACRARPPGRGVGALLAEFERALALSWTEAYAVVARGGAQAETLRHATRWLIEHDDEGER